MSGRLVVSVDLLSSTWLSARGVSVTVHHDSKPAGLRTILMLWLDAADAVNGGHPAGTVLRRVVDGDGRTDAYREVEPPETLTAAEAVAWLRDVEAALLLGYSDARAEGQMFAVERSRHRYGEAMRARAVFEAALERVQ